MTVTILQTADPFEYAMMLMHTSRTTVEFCRRHGHRPEIFVGIKRGCWPFHATFNRIYLLQELLDRGVQGWALYLDADAYIADLAFDLDAYLADKQRYLMIMTHGAHDGAPWDVNTGVMLFNLDHVHARPLLRDWLDAFEQADDDTLRGASDWARFGGDQGRLQAILRDQAGLSDHVLHVPKTFMNSPGASFIRQHLRIESRDFATRMAQIILSVEQILPSQTLPSGLDGLEDVLVAAAYDGVLQRPVDAGAATHFGKVLRQVGVRVGLSRLLKGLCSSREFRERVSAAPM